MTAAPARHPTTPGRLLGAGWPIRHGLCINDYLIDPRTTNTSVSLTYQEHSHIYRSEKAIALNTREGAAADRHLLASNIKRTFVAQPIKALVSHLWSHHNDRESPRPQALPRRAHLVVVHPPPNICLRPVFSSWLGHCYPCMFLFLGRLNRPVIPSRARWLPRCPTRSSSISTLATHPSLELLATHAPPGAADGRENGSEAPANR